MTQDRETILARLTAIQEADEKDHAAYEMRKAFSPVHKMQMARLRRVFYDCAQAHKSITPIISKCALTGAKTVSFPPCFDPGPLPESADTEAVYFMGLEKEPPQWKYHREQLRQTALNTFFNGVTLDELNAEQTATYEALEKGIIEEKPHYGPAMDYSHTEEGTAVGEYRDYFDGEADYRELVRNETGRVITVEAAQKRWTAFELAVQQTNRLAEYAELAGLRVKYVSPGEPNPENRPVRPVVALIPAGEPDHVIYMPNMQRIAAFPIFAQSLRAEKIRSLRYILDRKPFARMATFTSGTRERGTARLTKLNAGHKQFRRALGNMMKHPLFRRHIDGLYIGTEYGTPKLVSLDGITSDITFHLHAHFLYEPRLRWDGRIWSRTQWARLRKWCRLKLAAEMRGWTGKDRDRGLRDEDGIHCELGKLIGNVNEVCKYPFKGEDLDTLIELGGPAAVRTFIEQTKGLRYATPVGELKKLRNRVKMDTSRFVIVSTPDGSVVDIKKNWNLARHNAWDQRDRRNRRAALRRKLTPAAIAKRRHADEQALARRVRRPLWRLCELEQQLKAARRHIEAGEHTLHWQGVAAAVAVEKSKHHRFLADAFELYPRALNRAGLTDQLAAPWLADFRAKLERRGFRCEFDAVMRESGLDAESAAEVEKNRSNEKENRSGKVLRNHLMARCSPFASGKWRVSQPVLAVIGYTGDFAEFLSQTPRAANVVTTSRQHIAAALAVADRTEAMPPLRTRNADAPARPCLPGSHYPNNSPDPAASWPPTPEFWPSDSPEMAAETLQFA